jgi:hypothetical protein
LPIIWVLATRKAVTDVDDRAQQGRDHVIEAVAAEIALTGGDQARSNATSGFE